MANKKVILGRGLSSLLGEEPTKISKENKAPEAQMTLDVNLLVRGKYQPRNTIRETGIAELAQSIKKEGIIQPIVVRKIANDKYEILAGERRWTAAKKAQLTEVPVIVKDIDDQSALAIALIENLQREDLNALEEARALDRLIKEFSLTHQQAGEAVGKSRVAVSNLIRLLNMPLEIQKYLEQGDLEMGHARALLSLDRETQIKLARNILDHNLSVRDTEKRVRDLQHQEKPALIKLLNEKEHLQEFTQKLTQMLSLPFEIKSMGRTGGKVTIKCKNKQELDKLLAYLQSDKIA